MYPPVVYSSAATFPEGSRSDAGADPVVQHQARHRILVPVVHTTEVDGSSGADGVEVVGVLDPEIAAGAEQDAVPEPSAIVSGLNSGTLRAVDGSGCRVSLVEVDASHILVRPPEPPVQIWRGVGDELIGVELEQPVVLIRFGQANRTRWLRFSTSLPPHADLVR